MATIDSKIPEGALAEKWTNYKAHQKLVNPANKRRLDIIVVGTGLAGASAAASLGALGFKVLNFCIQDSPRRAHSIAAQGGINAAKNYQNDGDSVYRLFYDTIKGGDYRAREANVYRLAEVSNAIIDQCVAQGVPFAREYGGLLDNRSFGGAQVSRTFYARGQTGQQLLLGAYSALSREVQRGNVKLYTRYEMLDVVLIKDNEGVERARGIIARNLVTGKIERFAAHAVVIGALRSMTATRVLSSNVCPCGSVMRKVNMPFSCTAISALLLSNSCSQSVQSPSFIRYAIWYQPRFCASFTLTVTTALLLRFQPPGAVSTMRYGAHSSCAGALSARARCRLAASSISRQRTAIHCFNFRFIHFLLRAIGVQRGFQGHCPACRISC